MKNTQVLLINDMCGYGKVALSAMLPVLSHMGFRIHNLPTALVSDTLNYPKFYIHDTTEYVRQTLAIWEELGFEFDAISTGFIVTEEETRIISDFCRRRSERGTKVFVDPIMADNGKLYAGVPESTIGLMRDLVACADYTVPNYTEACLLTDTSMKEGMSADEARELVDAVRALGSKSVVVTSAKVDGADAIAGYDHVADEYFCVPIERRGRLVHEKHLGIRRQGAGDAQALLLAAGQAKTGLVELVLDLVPEGRSREAALHDLVCLGAAELLHARGAVEDVVADAHGKRVGMLKDHADVDSKRVGVHLEDVLAAELD